MSTLLTDDKLLEAYTRGDIQGVAKMKARYEKPIVEKVERMTFPEDILEARCKKRICRQCSSCHSCR